MVSSNTRRLALVVFPVLLAALPASAQDPMGNIIVQCPGTTDLHPGGPNPDGSGIRCEHLVAGDGFVTMADGYPQYMFGFAALPQPEPGVPYPLDGFGVMEQGMLAANFPAPTITVDEDDEFFLTLTNVGMAMRPDLFDPHTVHWHGFPQAASLFDGVPDASISINMGASLSYYYNVKDAGTYMYHCHVEATEHMQMGMLGNLYVRPRQNRCDDVSIPCPSGHAAGDLYAYNDGDGSTRYDVEYPIQIGSFDPDFHDASIEVQPLPFAGMKDRYFMLNGRGYPDTVDPNPLPAPAENGGKVSQPIHSLITATAGDRILLRISNLNVTHFDTLATVGIPMQVIALDARLLRDGAGHNLYYTTNSVTLGGGQSADVILDTAGLSGTFFLYTSNLHHLANDAENFGGMMTEIRIQ